MIDEKVKQDILAVIEESLQAIKDNDSRRLSDASNKIIHCASIFQDKFSLTIAVIIYALAKMLMRGSIIDKRIIERLERMRQCLKDCRDDVLERELSALRTLIESRDNRISLYVRNVINDAQIKKGSRIYEHGISLAQTASMLGISEWELMKYIGQTTIEEHDGEGVGTKKRLAFTRGLFGL